MFKFLHSADLHLDSPLRGLERYEGAPLDEVRGATRRAFENLVQLAVDEQVAFVLIAGDLYDGDWKDYNTGLFFVQQMHRLREAGIRVFVIAGNHDAASQITKALRLPANVKVFPTKTPERVILDDLGVAIYGQGFATQAVREDLAAAYPKGEPQLFNIGLLHTCLDGKPGHEPYAPCSVDGLKSKGYQYWALGHVHKREIVCTDPWIVFPGNLQGRHARETGPKGVTLVTIDQGEVVQVEQRDLDVIRWTTCTVDVSGAATGSEVYERGQQALVQELARSEGRPLAVRLVLTGDCKAHSELHSDPERWVNEFRGLAAGLSSAGLWVEKVSFDTRREVSLTEHRPQEGAIGELLQLLCELQRDTNALRQLSLELDELKNRLPPEIAREGEGFDPTDIDTLKRVLPEVEELLLARLLAIEVGR